MRKLHTTIAMVALGLLTAISISAQAQSTDNARFLSLAPSGGLPIIPVLEGWIANPDGTTTFSYGVINRNEEAVDLPLGTANYIEPAKYHGMQPTHFPAGRSTGIFSVTVPAADQALDVWWYLKTGNTDALKVPGRHGVSAYELDFIRPRPQGAMQPLAGFGETGTLTSGLIPQLGDFQNTVTTGTAVILSVNVKDPSVRDTSDPRFAEPIPIGVHFSKYQGPGDVVFERHADTEVAENPYDEDDPRSRFFREPKTSDVNVAGGEGVARVIATFSEPGEYMIHTKVENFRAPDSSDGDQCCWTNIIQRVTVTP